MPHITPTVGRVVHYVCGPNDGSAPADGSSLAAIVAAVNADGTVNLAVFGSNGNLQPRLNVTLVQEGESAPADEGYAQWMPYQLGQAAKTEAVLAAAAAAPAPAVEESPAAVEAAPVVDASPAADAPADAPAAGASE